MTEDHDPTTAPAPTAGPGLPDGSGATTAGIAGMPRRTDGPAGPGGAPSTAPGHPGEATPPQQRRRGRRWPWVLIITVAVAVAVASRINLNYYALEPGTAQSVQQFITVPPDKSHPVHHPVLLTDVEIGRVTALSYLYFKLQSDTALEQVEDVTGGTPPAQLNAQGALEMSQAESAAKAAALRRLGYPVTATPSGAVVFGVFPGTPADGVLNVADVITAVDGKATPTATDLTRTLATYHSGETITLTVRKGGTAPPAPERITLRNTKVQLSPTQTASLDLGIDTEDQVDFTYPFPVSIDVTNIGGPSAGLAMTLGVIDALDNGSVTGGRTVAATGTIDAEGDVGDVGGVPQKTVAVERAGATIFLVPPQEYKNAMSQDRPGLKIYAVATLDQALAVLAAHGGSVPPPPAASSPTPTSSTPAGSAG